MPARPSPLRPIRKAPTCWGLSSVRPEGENGQGVVAGRGRGCRGPTPGRSASANVVVLDRQGGRRASLGLTRKQDDARRGGQASKTNAWLPDWNGRRAQIARVR